MPHELQLPVEHTMEYVIGFWVICGIVGGIIGSSKHAGVGGFLLGLLLGPLGVLAAFALDGRPKCEFCKTPMDPEAQQCPQCLKAQPSTSGDGRRRMSLQPVGDGSGDDPDEPQQVHFPCKSCRHELTWPASEGGNKILCDECGSPNKVPDIFGTSIKKPANVINCPDCGGTVSKRVENCPHCGCPVGSVS